MALENWRSRSVVSDVTPNDVFCAKLARMAMTFDKDHEKAAALLACKASYEFNHLINSGSVRRLAQSAEFRTEFQCTVVTGVGDTKILMMHIDKGSKGICGAEDNSIYIAFAPPVNPHTWKMFSNLSIDDAGINAGFSALLSKKVRGSINTFIDKHLAAHLDGADMLDVDSWAMNCYLVGYGFGGALAAAAAAKMNLPECLRKTLVTFGAPVAGDGARLSLQIQNVRRFSHAGDPITRLFVDVDEYKQFGAALRDDVSVTKYDPRDSSGESRSTKLCRESACAVQYAGIDFRTKELANMYSVMPPFLVTMMFNQYAGKVKNLWNNVARWSVLAHKQGETRCPWDVEE